MNKLIPKYQTAWGKMPTYLLVLDKMKTENPVEYDRLIANRAKAEHPYSEVVLDENGKSRINTGAGYLSAADPVGEFVVGNAVLNPVFKAAGTAALYGMGRTGSNWARAKLISRAMTPSKAVVPVVKPETTVVQKPEITVSSPYVRINPDVTYANEAVSVYPKDLPWNFFLLIKDNKTPGLKVNSNGEYSVHFKTNRNAFRPGEKLEMFDVLESQIPEGAKVSTWGNLTKGGYSGLNRFGNLYGYTKVGTRQADIPVYLKSQVPTTRLYRTLGTNALFNASRAANGEALRPLAGMWFTDLPDKIHWYAHNILRGKNPDKNIELLYVDVPTAELYKYKASANKLTLGMDYEPEDFIIPFTFKRKIIPLESNMNYAGLKKDIMDKISKLNIEDFKSELDWSPKSWFKDAAKRDSWTPEDELILASHVPEYLEIEKAAKANGTWLKMKDGSTWLGDPRSWVQMQSKYAKKKFSTPVVYHNSKAKFDHFDDKYLTDFDGAFFASTDPKYASNFGPIQYLGRLAGKPLDVETPFVNGELYLVWMEDAARPDVMTNPVSLYRGHDKVTGEFKPSKGFEYMFEKSNLFKSLLGNNGDFNLKDKNIYRILAPFLFGTSYLNKKGEH